MRAASTALIWNRGRDNQAHAFIETRGDHMSTFDERGDAFESKYAHDQTLRFKAMARRNKALGLWAAEKLGLTGEEASAYAGSVVAADLEEAGDEDVYRKVKGDFDAKGIDVSEHRLRRTMDELLAEAIETLQKNG
jgi:hypothetical protein